MTQFNAWPLGGGVWVGPVRRPRNSAANEKGSIHDDAVAQKLGFRGGTVAASLHMEQFPPLLLHMFGPRWWESGGLSLYFRYATTDLEPAQCHAVAPMRPPSEDVRIEVWMEHAENRNGRYRTHRRRHGVGRLSGPRLGTAAAHSDGPGPG